MLMRPGDPSLLARTKCTEDHDHVVQGDPQVAWSNQYGSLSEEYGNIAEAEPAGSQQSLITDQVTGTSGQLPLLGGGVKQMKPDKERRKGAGEKGGHGAFSLSLSGLDTLHPYMVLKTLLLK